jgi:hypothetical protein
MGTVEVMPEMVVGEGVATPDLEEEAKWRGWSGVGV